MSPSALEILEVSDNGFKINSKNFNSVLSKVGDRPFVLYSINGPTNTGKSFALNFLLRFWEAKTHHVHDWFGHDLKGTKFVWQTEKELARQTIGIHLWSEPYFVTQKSQEDDEDEEEVAVLLMDTQGLFDEKTTDQENAIVFSLSSLCSSVSIFNLPKEIDESALERLQFFSGYAHLASQFDDIAPGQGSKMNQIEAFEKLVFLIRDFESKDYECGYHDMYWTVPPSPKNICLDTFVNTSELDPLKKFAREQILECYRSVSVYLMPSPGELFLKNHQEKVNEKFNVHMKKFVELLTSAGRLPTKRVGGQRITGAQFEKYIERWVEICTQANSHFPKGQTHEESTAIVQNTLAFGTFSSEYEKKIRNFIETHPKGFTDSELLSVHETWQKEGLENFFAMKKGGDEELQARYGDLLLDHTTEFFETIRKENQIKQMSQEDQEKLKKIEKNEKKEHDGKSKGETVALSNIKEFIHKGLHTVFGKLF